MSMDSNVVDYLIGNFNSLCNSISDFSIANKQHDSNHCPLFFTMSKSVSSRPPTPLVEVGFFIPIPRRQIQQYVLDIKHELTYVPDETYTSLDDHNQTWLQLIQCAPQPIFSKTPGGKQHDLIAIVERPVETSIRC